MNEQRHLSCYRVEVMFPYLAPCGVIHVRTDVAVLATSEFAASQAAEQWMSESEGVLVENVELITAIGIVAGDD